MNSRHFFPAVLLAASIGGGALGAPKAALPVPEATVAQTSVAPVIDGKIGPGEWDHAMACTGFVQAFEGTLAHLQSVAHITYDDRYIYVCIRNLRGEKHTLLRAMGRRPDDDMIVFDHANEIWLVPPSLPPRLYQTLFNVYPGVMDALQIPSLGYTAKSWKGKWEFASSQGKSDWIIEARAPISSFGAGRIDKGAVWKGLFTTDILGDGDKFRAWAPGGGYADIDRQGILRFAGDSPVFQLLNIESVFTGKIRFPVAVTAPANGRAEVIVSARFGRGVTPAPEDMEIKRTVSVANGERQAFDLEGDISRLDLVANKAGQKTGYCEIDARAGESVLYHQVFPFVLDGYVRHEPTQIQSSPYDTAFGIKASYAPLNKKLLVQIDRYYLANRQDVVSGSARLIDPATKKVIAERKLAPFFYDFSEFPIDLSQIDVPVETEADWAAARPAREANAGIARQNKELKAAGKPELPLTEVPGPKPREYVLKVDLENKAGQVLASTESPVKMIGYQFEWMPNHLGYSDKVIAPWTPMQWQGNTVTMWNKTYTLNALGLAEKIVNGGTPQLSGEMRLMATVNGREHKVSGGALQLEKPTESGADFSGSSMAEGFEFSNRGRVEFDGYVLNTLTVTPRSDATLERVSLVISMPKSEAPCLVTTSGGWAAYHGWTPEHWDSRETSSGSRRGNFVPYVFLTDSDRGFCWFADNERGWLLDPEQPTQEVKVEGGVTTLRVNFVNKPGKLSQPLTVRYGWTVSPQKPQPEGWRSYLISSVRPNPRATSVFWNDADWAVVWPYYSSPFPRSYEKSAALLKNAVRTGQRPFVGNIAHAIGRYENYDGRKFDGLGADWGDVPGRLTDGNVVRTAGTNDFQVWHFDRWITRSGLSGLYFDENYLSEDFNYLTGGAYLLPDESVQPGYSYIGLRDYQLRLRHLFDSHGVPKPNIWLHTTGGQPTYAWFPDVTMEAENVEPSSLENDYPAVMSAARLRAIGIGTNLGSAPFLMCQANRHWTPGIGPLLVRQLVGWVLLHDALPEGVLFWSTLSGELETWRREIRFLPYWKPGQGVQTSDADILASAHVADHQGVVWVFNLARQDKLATVTLDLPRLGFDPGKTRLYDLETGENAPLENGAFRVRVPAREWRAIRLKQPVLLEGDQTFVATFDKEASADEALGNPLPRQAVFPDLVEGKQGRALSLDKPVIFETRHHLFAARGNVAFQVKIDSSQPSGTLVTLGSLKIRLGNGKLNLNDGAGKLQEAALLPGEFTAGWQELRLSWVGESVIVFWNGAEILKGSLPGGMPIPPMGRGLEIADTHRPVTPVGIVLGPVAGAALDDLRFSK